MTEQRLIDRVRPVFWKKSRIRTRSCGIVNLYIPSSCISRISHRLAVSPARCFLPWVPASTDHHCSFRQVDLCCGGKHHTRDPQWDEIEVCGIFGCSRSAPRIPQHRVWQLSVLAACPSVVTWLFFPSCSFHTTPQRALRLVVLNNNNNKAAHSNPQGHARVQSRPISC